MAGGAPTNPVTTAGPRLGAGRSRLTRATGVATRAESQP